MNKEKKMPKKICHRKFQNFNAQPQGHRLLRFKTTYFAVLNDYIAAMFLVISDDAKIKVTNLNLSTSRWGRSLTVLPLM